MVTVPLLLMIVALILFILAAAGVSGGRVGLQPAGLACWVLAHLWPLV